MLRLPVLSFVAILAVLVFPHRTDAQDVAPAGNCVECHVDMKRGFSAGHAFGADNCIACHAGDPGATDEKEAHADMLSFPGERGNAERACGACHADRVAGVKAGLMHTGQGMVFKARRLLDGVREPDTSTNLQSLGHSVADSMLRKQCASCHLGQQRLTRAIDPTADRGGGCRACHINEYPETGHPALSRQVSSGRCFGCHSRSGRISLSYAGFAEVDESESHLADGRPVSQLQPDVHYLAGMGCVDCHLADDVMGAAPDALHQRDAVLAKCTDCHETHDDRLTCASCHSQWAPQCFGCHMEYDESGEQWDHVERAVTPGRWDSKRWGVRNGLPPLGVNSAGEIDVFVPGMIMTVEHPEWESSRFFREFAPLSPHTTGPSRSCMSCHRSAEALGLGRGQLSLRNGSLEFRADADMLQDGLPADAWTNTDKSLGGRASIDGERPLNPVEMREVFGAELPGD
jgi:hypothetical protein